MRKHKISCFRILLPAAYMALIFFFSSQGNLIRHNIHPFDKLIHFTEYAILSVLLARAFQQKNFRFAHAVICIVISTVFGISDEYHQSFVPGRSAELADVLADCAGSCIVLIFPYAASLRKFL